MKLLAITLAVLLALCVAARADVQAPTVTDDGSGGSTNPVGDTIMLLFGSSSGSTGNCMGVGADPAGGGTLVACTTEGQTLHQLTVEGVPTIIGISCVHTTGMATMDDGEALTFTPIFTQGVGDGTWNKTDSTTTTAFQNDAHDDEGDTVSNFTDDESPYTGPQGIQIRVDVTGAVSITEIGCAVLVTLDV